MNDNVTITDAIEVLAWHYGFSDEGLDFIIKDCMDDGLGGDEGEA